MKKMGVTMGLLMASSIGIGAYFMMKKKTKSKVKQILNNMIDTNISKED